MPVQITMQLGKKKEGEIKSEKKFSHFFHSCGREK
jgi:hypothetical protein